MNEYEKWVEDVTNLYNKFWDIAHLLNDEGTQQLKAFRTLAQMAEWCNTAGELLDWILTEDELDQEDKDALSNGRGSAAIKALMLIAAEEKKETEK